MHDIGARVLSGLDSVFRGRKDQNGNGHQGSGVSVFNEASGGFPRRLTIWTCLTRARFAEFHH